MCYTLIRNLLNLLDNNDKRLILSVYPKLEYADDSEQVNINNNIN